MDITLTPTPTPTPAPTSTTSIAPTILTASTTTLTKSPEQQHETETPTTKFTTSTTPKISPFSNGVLKRFHHHHHHFNHHNNHQPTITYKECLKNHAANLGGHALDGCGEFMTSPTATPTDPTSLKCAACGCHRNFHRREPEEPPLTTTHVIEYQPHHRHQPLPPPPFSHRSPNSSSPPPISSSYYPSAPHMLLALSAALPENVAAPNQTMLMNSHSNNSRKRFRTKFTQDQKDKMLKFAEKVGWKMQKKDDEFVHEFCNEIGVDRSVLKVWMHNNKNTLAKRENINTNNDINDGVKSFQLPLEDEEHKNNVEIHGLNHNHYQNEGGVVGVTVRANGSSSSS
ncbi:putative transcription factor ZF-HD family [Medicago truncatula]|uniref:Homeobox domain, ZF-HD class protein n=1 Tax=Medicago truncatula TaxID=3880 RepID=A2Q1B8_MEDTR|nr:zinc-finger homeodomain protein 9 [Medicago truncatula]ABN05735.1 Homeobox domain, ZF-HD class; ZF-HD homeobox protein Cys/His-rich dimerisation region; Homeodomain-like [Medicago truncatula]ABN08930.1 Homeobox domain, ZF-HD class; ZF-HD homeobox protein Cys/His-rich dimerisation region; Homeodomain-like [Medicago truncatula]AES77411.1 homeobox domain, ZF-HD class protein [Medicago truncatula]RHN44240.1 putative transcription factor ZF-HD family [Medicago truncatula]